MRRRETVDPEVSQTLLGIIHNAGTDGITSGALYQRYYDQGNHDYHPRSLLEILQDLVEARQVARVCLSFGQGGNTSIWWPPGVDAISKVEAIERRRRNGGVD